MYLSAVLPHRDDGKAFFMGFRKKLKTLHKTLLRSVQNAKEFKTAPV